MKKRWIMIKINELIREYREKAKMTQEQVANQLFVSRSTYTQYETGQRNVDSEMFFKIIDIFGVEISFKEKKQLEWTLKYLDHDKKEEDQPIYVLIYEEDAMYDLELYEWDEEEQEIGELIQVNTFWGRHGKRLSKKGVDGVLKFEIKELNYRIVRVDYKTFDDIDFVVPEPSRKGKKSIYTFTTRLLRCLLQDLLKRKFGFKPNITVYVDGEMIDSLQIKANDEKTENIFKELFLEHQPNELEIVKSKVDAHLKKYPTGSSGLEREFESQRIVFGESFDLLEGESEQEFYQRTEPLMRERLIQNWYEMSYEDFHWGLATLLFEKLLGEKIIKCVIDKNFEDIVYIHTKV